MTLRWRTIARCAGLLAVVGWSITACSGHEKQTTRAERDAVRRAKAEQLASMPPIRHTYRLEAGELIVIDVPIVAPGGFADSQKCFLWRDIEFQTASLQCPSESGADLPDINDSPTSQP
jgi:hypothetical protein